MSVELNKKIEELSLLLVMVDASDTPGVQALIELLKQFVTIGKKNSKIKRCIDAAESVVSICEKSKDNSKTISLIQTFVSSAQAYLNGSENVKFSNELPQTNLEVPLADVNDQFDAEFLVDFIEKHNLLLEEFEGTVVDFRFNLANANHEVIDKFSKYIKSYLHGMKGDAGSIGLSGIELVTHKLEDILAEQPLTNLLDVLILYKEWVHTCLKAFSQNIKPPELSEKFLPRFLSSVPKPTEKKDKTNLVAEHSQIENQVVAQPESPSSHPESPAQDEYIMTAESDIFAEFAAEAEDHLSKVEEVLLQGGEEFPPDDIDTIFRAVHSLKGASSYFGLMEINQTSHILENLLDEVRDGKRILDPALVNLVFSYIDLQKKLLITGKKALENNGKVKRIPASAEYLKALEAYVAGEKIPPALPPQAAPPVMAGKNQIPKHEFELAPSTDLSVTSKVSDEQALSKTVDTRFQNKLGVKTFVKVDTSRLDLLIDSIGEMVIYSSMLIRSCRELLGEHDSIIKTTHQVEKFSRELQDIGMSMRLDPIKGLFQKMSRLVWDVSKKLGKDIQFIMHGEETELDRTVIEKLADPLMHMIRNAMDHGIEPPEDRKAKNKPNTGSIELSAFHVGGSIHIQIRDDGRGLNPEKLRAKAVEKGILTESQVITEQEAFQLIFAPGFSTAAAVTDISGRGVGMDVVRNNIQSMRGQIRIESVVDKGTTFTIELPLTLAIIEGIETLVGTERFIVPTLSILEFMKPSRKFITTAVGRGETFYFRGRYLPLYRLSELYFIEPRFTDPTEATVIVVENSGEQVAIMVDEVVSSCQVVIKNLGTMFVESKGISGCAIMPNGDIGLILDVRSLVQLARADYSHKALTKSIYSDIAQELSPSLNNQLQDVVAVV